MSCLCETFVSKTKCTAAVGSLPGRLLLLSGKTNRAYMDERVGLGGPNEQSGRPWWTRMYELPL